MKKSFVTHGKIVGVGQTSLVDHVNDPKLLSPDYLVVTPVAIESDLGVEHHDIYGKLNKDHMHEHVILSETYFHDSKMKTTTIMQQLYIDSNQILNQPVLRRD